MSYRLERSLFIPKPRREVFAFFADAFNLDRITPTSLRFHTVTPAPIEMRPGTLIDYEMHLYGVKLRWKARIAGAATVRGSVGRKDFRLPKRGAWEDFRVVSS